MWVLDLTYFFYLFYAFNLKRKEEGEKSQSHHVSGDVFKGELGGDCSAVLAKEDGTRD